MATQTDIAQRLGLSRSTVSKILNRDPRYYASAKTREKVFAMAERLGYDFATVKRPYKREHPRTPVGAPCELTITLLSGEVFDHGTATVVNISEGGALLSNIRTERMVLPLESFRMLVKLSGIEMVNDLVGECEIVRMRQCEEGPDIGVRFSSTTEEDRRRLRELVKRRLEEILGRGA